MIEKILNGYVKIEPVIHKTFIPSERETYEEIGKVVAKDDKLEDIPIGSLCFFDSYMAKKYPIAGDDERFQWFIQASEIVKIEYKKARKKGRQKNMATVIEDKPKPLQEDKIYDGPAEPLPKVEM